MLAKPSIQFGELKRSALIQPREKREGFTVLKISADTR